MMENYNERNEEKMEVQVNEKKGRMSVRKLAKRGLTFSLCAILAGGVAAGSYEAVNAFTGWNQNTVQAATDQTAALLTSESDSDETRTKGNLDVADIVEEALPSVVCITTKSVQEVEDYFGYYGFYGFGPGESYEQEVESRGSGVIVGKSDDNLLIVTNSHVVKDTNSVTVTFADGESYEAKVNGYDDDKDIAVVSVSFEDLTDDTLSAIDIAKIGSSDDLRVGEQILVIVNALGYGQSVTTGIVSSKSRQMNDEEDGVNLIQTDAAINPGNSGGAMLNMDGELVGISNSKSYGSLVEGMCYAIAISDVADGIEELMNQVPRDVVEDHGFLGITGSTVSEEAQMYGIPEGVFVREVTEDSGADKAGIKENSIITKFDGKSVDSIEELVNLLTRYEVGEEIDVVIAVPDGGEYKEQTVTVTLGKDPSGSDTKDKDQEKPDDDFFEEEEEPEEPEGPERWGDGFQFGKPAWN